MQQSKQHWSKHLGKHLGEYLGEHLGKYRRKHLGKYSGRHRGKHRSIPPSELRSQCGRQTVNPSRRRCGRNRTYRHNSSRYRCRRCCLVYTRLKIRRMLPSKASQAHRLSSYLPKSHYERLAGREPHHPLQSVHLRICQGPRAVRMTSARHQTPALYRARAKRGLAAA